MRLVLASLLALAACQRGPAPADNRAAPAAPAPAPKADGDVAAAQRLVRQRLGTTGEVHFVEARRGTHDGVAIVCGAYQQGGTRQRYIVVNAEEVFVEPRMRPGEMDRSFREFCGDGERG